MTRVREPRSQRDEPTAVKGSTRLEAKKQRRREGREAGRRRTIITEAEFLARRESVERVMVVRGRGDRTQIGVLEDGVLVEHYVSRETTASMAGNVYLGRVQNVLPSMEAAFVDIGKGRNAVLYAGEVNWDAAGLEGGQARRIENALIVRRHRARPGHQGPDRPQGRPAHLADLAARPLPRLRARGLDDRHLAQAARHRAGPPQGDPQGGRARPRGRHRAHRRRGRLRGGAARRRRAAHQDRGTRSRPRPSRAGAKKAGSGGAPALLHGEPDLTVRVIRDVFTEDFTSLVVSGDKAWGEVSQYVEDVAPDLAPRLQRWTAEEDVFAAHRIDESLAKAMDRKVWLPSGGSLVIDRTEAMTVVDVNTGKFVGSGGNLEETVTKNNLEAAEEIVRQLRLRDIGGIIVIDFIDMVLESNRDLVVRRLLECLGRDRTKHQVAEVTSLGLVQMTRKRVGSGLVEVFSEPCEHCGGRGIVVHSEPIDRSGGTSGWRRRARAAPAPGRGRRGQGSPARLQAGNGSGGSGGAARRPGRRAPSSRPARPRPRSPPPRTPRPCARPRHGEHAHDRRAMPVERPRAAAVAQTAVDATSGPEPSSRRPRREPAEPSSRRRASSPPSVESPEADVEPVRRAGRSCRRPSSSPQPSSSPSRSSMPSPSPSAARASRPPQARSRRSRRRDRRVATAVRRRDVDGWPHA